MGGDGQALANKRRLLEDSRVFLTADQLRKVEGKAQGATQTEKQRSAQRWTHCALSLEPLEFPVVFDLCGRLYSKRAVLDELLGQRHRRPTKEKSEGEKPVIARLSDVCEIAGVEDGERPCIQCPLSGFEASSGLHKFVGFWGCGHVVCTASCSEPAVKQSGVRDATGSAAPTFVACPFCGEESFQVPLILDTEADEVAQWKRLRPLQRLACKRRRSKG
ncbi:putative replication termination factor [Trypanosoma conorhini]|uniref:Putative replication termination factor n=1 Tax=Trypanosoma conorhini TaxID=83891 RepID=A0A3R7P270_9TRYP|nr:putative replication termination factor [Trypanosoma conorhini]RNF11571.1 putative replication termination factor [Trypanosoma conorhini]